MAIDWVFEYWLGFGGGDVGRERCFRLRNDVRKESVAGDFPGGPVVKTSPSNAGGAGSIPGRGAKIPHVLQPKSQNIKQKQCCNKYNKAFKTGPHSK